MSSIGESSTASRSGPSAHRFWPKRLRDWFEIPSDRPGAASCRDLMILAYPVRPERASLIPAVLHHDGTCRVQVVDRRADSAVPRFDHEIPRALGRAARPQHVVQRPGTAGGHAR